MANTVHTTWCNSNVFIFPVFICQNSHHLKSLTLKIYVKVIEYNTCNGPIRWQISTTLKVRPGHFSLALSIFEIITFQIRYLENIGQGHDIQHLQLCHSMANINLHKSHIGQFELELLSFGDIYILNFWLWQFRSKSRDRKTGPTLFDSKYQPA